MQLTQYICKICLAGAGAHSSQVEYLPSMCGALGSPSNKTKKGAISPTATKHAYCILSCFQCKGGTPAILLRKLGSHLSLSLVKKIVYSTDRLKETSHLEPEAL